MDRQVIELVREFVELGFFTLIMLGLCTTAICLTRVWATQELVKAINAGKAFARANEAQANAARHGEGRSDVILLPDLSSFSYSSVR